MKRLFVALALVLFAMPALAQTDNIWIGHQAGGLNAGPGNSGANRNIGLGNESCLNAMPNSFAVCIGDGAGRATPGAGQVFVGPWAGRDATNTLYSIFIGLEAGRYNANATYNTLVGWGIGISLVGSSNSGFGHDVFKIAKTSFSSAFGKESQYKVEGDSNATFGAFSMGNTNTGGARNSFFGNYSGYIAYANGAVGMGWEAGYRAGSYSVHLGHKAGKNDAREQVMHIGNGEVPLVFGRFDQKCIVIGATVDQPGCEANIGFQTLGKVSRMTNLTTEQAAAIVGSVSQGAYYYDIDTGRMTIHTGGVWRGLKYADE